MPVYQKREPLQKENYIPVALQMHISKVLDRVIYKQINKFRKTKSQNVS